MLDTEIELQNIRTVVDVFKNELINITLEIKKSLSSKHLSEKKKEILYEKLRKMHHNLKAAQESERILIENPPSTSTVIHESVELAKSEELERRNNYRDRLFYDNFQSKAIDYSLPSYYRDLISLIVKEIYAIRDAVDPPIGKKYHKELRKIEKEILVDRYAPAIQEYLDQEWNYDQIAKKLGIDKEQINYAIENYKPDKEKLKNSLKNNNDLQERILCSDGNCIGVINNDGYCNECGKPNSNKK